MMGAPVRDILSDGDSTYLELSFLTAGAFPRVTTAIQEDPTRPV
jgi:hypothetical protein